MTYEENALAHYGIKGQKWGVRRYLNDDGTLTDLGKKHYGEDYTKRERPRRILRNLTSALNGYEKAHGKQFKAELKLNRMEKIHSRNEKANDSTTRLGRKMQKQRSKVEIGKKRLDYLMGYQISILNKAFKQNNDRKFQKRMENIGINSEFFNKLSNEYKTDTNVQEFLKTHGLK